MIFCTGTFAMGDARYLTRVKLPDEHGVVPAPYTDGEILDIFEALATYSGAMLLAVSKGIYYNTGTVPDADPELEHRAKVLLKHEDGSISQIEIPMIEPNKAMTPSTLVTELNAVHLESLSNSAIESVIQINRNPERKARGR